MAPSCPDEHKGCISGVCLRHVSHLLVCLYGSDILCLLSFYMIFFLPCLGCVFFGLSLVMCHLFVLISFSMLCYLCVNIATVIVPKSSSSAIWSGRYIYLYKQFFSQVSTIFCGFLSSHLCCLCFFSWWWMLQSN